MTQADWRTWCGVRPTPPLEGRGRCSSPWWCASGVHCAAAGAGCCATRADTLLPGAAPHGCGAHSCKHPPAGIHTAAAPRLVLSGTTSQWPPGGLCQGRSCEGPRVAFAEGGGGVQVCGCSVYGVSRRRGECQQCVPSSSHPASCRELPLVNSYRSACVPRSRQQHPLLGVAGVTKQLHPLFSPPGIPGAVAAHLECYGVGRALATRTEAYSRVMRPAGFTQLRLLRHGV